MPPLPLRLGFPGSADMSIHRLHRDLPGHLMDLLLQVALRLQLPHRLTGFPSRPPPRTLCAQKPPRSGRVWMNVMPLSAKPVHDFVYIRSLSHLQVQSRVGVVLQVRQRRQVMFVAQHKLRIQRGRALCAFVHSLLHIPHHGAAVVGRQLAVLVHRLPVKEALLGISTVEQGRGDQCMLKYLREVEGLREDHCLRLRADNNAPDASVEWRRQLPRVLHLLALLLLAGTAPHGAPHKRRADRPIADHLGVRHLQVQDVGHAAHCKQLRHVVKQHQRFWDMHVVPNVRKRPIDRMAGQESVAELIRRVVGHRCHIHSERNRWMTIMEQLRVVSPKHLSDG
mmetsp:Transcript_16537/g.52728  ORF Transcript_16537/g.52728 Transcript_16537/m.52728 type:complete len:338 (-) Transcript_16537:87-1100(-)